MMPGDHALSDLEEPLAAELASMVAEGDGAIRIATIMGSNAYVQFAVIGDGMVSWEVASNEFLDDRELSEADAQALRDMGFSDPDPNFSRMVDSTSADELQAAAAQTRHIFAEVFHADPDTRIEITEG